MTSGSGYLRRTGFLLASLGRRADAAWGAFLRGRGLTQHDFAALAVLADGPCHQRRLADHLAIDPRNASNLVARLRERGWVDGAADPADARRTVLTLTAPGVAAWESVRDDAAAARTDYLRALTPAERRQLERLLNKLQDSFVGPGPAPGGTPT